MDKKRRVKSSSRIKADSGEGSIDNNKSEHSPSPPQRDRNQSRLRRHRSGSEQPRNERKSSVDSGADVGNPTKKKKVRKKRKKKLKRLSKAATTTGSASDSSDWSPEKTGESKLPTPPRRQDSKPKELSEQDLVDWMRKMVPYVEPDSPYWNTWTLSSIYHFIRNPQVNLCIAFIWTDDDTETSPRLSRLSKVCQGPLITVNQLIPEYRGGLFYLLKTQPVSVDGLNYDEVVMFGNIPDGDEVVSLNNLLVHYWAPILRKEEFLPVGIKNDVFTELNTTLCSAQTTAHYYTSQNQLLLYIPEEIYQTYKLPSETCPDLASDKQFTCRLEETIVYWISKLKHAVSLKELDDTDIWPGPLEEIQFWTSRAVKFKNILSQIKSPEMHYTLKILATSHSPYMYELKEVFQQVHTEYLESNSNAYYLQPLCQPLEALQTCKLKDMKVEMQKVAWLTLTIWRNSPYYNTPVLLNSLLRKFSNTLVLQCTTRINVEETLRGSDPPRKEAMLTNCLKCLQWWKEIYKMTEKMYKCQKDVKEWIFDEEKIFTHVNALIHRINDILEISKTQTLYKQDTFPVYPGICGPHVTSVMKTCKEIFTAKINELVTQSELILNVKSNDWHVHMKDFRDTILGIDMCVQNVLEKSFNQLPNLAWKLELLKLFQRFHGKRDIVTRQLDKLCVQLFEYFQNQLVIVKTLFERKVVPLPLTFTEMAGKGAWAEFMRRRVVSDLSILKKAESWLPLTGGVVYQSLVKAEAKSLIEQLAGFTAHTYEEWTRQFIAVGNFHREAEDQRGKLDVALLVRGKRNTLKINFDRNIYRNLHEAEMWVRIGRSVPLPILMTIYPVKDRLHGLQQVAGAVAKWYNRCIAGLSNDELLLFKDRLLPLERKIYPCLSAGKLTWLGEKTAEHMDIFLNDFREMAKEVLGNIEMYRRFTARVAETVELICGRKLVKLRMKKIRAFNGVYELEDFMEAQNGQIEKSMRKIIKGYREIGSTLKELFMYLFKRDGPEVKIQWEKYVNLVDNCFEEAIKWSAQQSLEMLANVIGSDDRDKPVFKVNLLLNQASVQFDPSLEELAQVILGVQKNIGKSVDPMVRLGRFLGVGTVGGRETYREALMKDKICLEFQKQLEFSVERCISELNLYSERWIPYRDIWEIDRNEFVKNYENQKPTLEAYERDLQRYRKISEVVHGGESTVTIRWLQVDCVKFKETISEQSMEWFNTLAGALYAKGKGSLEKVYKFMEENKNVLGKEPESLEEQGELWRTLDNVKTTGPESIGVSFEEIHDQFELLRRLRYEIEPETETMETNLRQEWRKFKKFLRTIEGKLEQSKERMKEAFIHQWKMFQEKVTELENRWENDAPFSCDTNKDFGSDMAIENLANFKREVKTLQVEETGVLTILESLNELKSKNGQLALMDENIDFLELIWEQVRHLELKWTQLNRQAIKDLKIEELETLAAEFSKIFQQLHEKYEIKSWPVILDIRQFLDIVKQSLKCCLYLRQHSLQLRHWEWIKKLVLQRNEPSDLTEQLPDSPEQISFGVLVKLKIYRLITSIEDLSWSSEKELVVEKTLQNIETFWENESFLVKRMLCSVTFKVEIRPELVVNLMDHLVSLTAMKGSKYAGVFQEKVDFWSERLQHLEEYLQPLLKTQEEWIILDKIFSKEHISRDIPTCSRIFAVITSVWASIVLIVTKVKNVVKVINDTDNIGDLLGDLGERMDDLRNKLKEYLLKIRNEFPRFYFLPDEQLLSCIGNESESCMLDAMSKMFGNFGDLSVEESDSGDISITGLISKDRREELKLLDAVEIKNEPLECWMGDFLNIIHNSVKANMEGCLAEFAGKWGKLEEIMVSEEWTEQSLLNAIKIYWTRDVCKAIKESSPHSFLDSPLKKYVKRMKKNVATCVDILRSRDFGNNERTRVVKNVIVTLLNLKDVTERLVERKCNDLESFEWLQYMRWYWSDGCFTVTQGFSSISYSWEYCHGERTIVMTPATERCFLSLTTAIGFQMGGLIHGKANSGKRHTISELGYQFGKFVVNLTIDAATDYDSLRGLVSGIVQTGSWGVLTGLEKCNIEVVNMVVSKLSLITKAKLGNHETIMLDGVKVKLDTGCGIFVVTDKIDNEEKMTRIKSVLRPVALIQPEAGRIIEMELFLNGFEKTSFLATKIENAFLTAQNEFMQTDAKLCSLSLSGMLIVVKRASYFKKLYGKRLTELEVVIKALEFVMLPLAKNEHERSLLVDAIKWQFSTEQVPSSAIASDEIIKLEYFVREAFEKLEYQISEEMVQQCLRLYELMQTNKAVIILGESATGKTTIRKILKLALTLMHQEDQTYALEEDFNTQDSREEMNDCQSSFINEHIINPAVIQGTKQLFGCFKNGKWSDGILTKILRWFQPSEDQSHEQQDTKLWLIFDGPISNSVLPEHVKSLSSGNQISLSNCDSVSVKGNINVIFEVDSLQDASPGLISNCGILCVRGDTKLKDVVWKLLYESWLNSLRFKEAQQEYSCYLGSLLERCLTYRESCAALISYTSRFQLIQLFIVMTDEYLQSECDNFARKDTEKLSRMLRQIIAFCIVWSIFVGLDQEAQKKASVFLKDLPELSHVFPQKRTVFDFYPNLRIQKWESWECLISAIDYSKGGIVDFVETIESVKADFLLRLLFSKNGSNISRPILFSGETASGKTSLVSNMMKKKHMVTMRIQMTPKITPLSVQSLIKTRLESVSSFAMSPPSSQHLTVVIDDLHVCQQESRVSPVCEYIRYVVEQSRWYDAESGDPQAISNISFIATATPATRMIPTRLLNRFLIMHIPEPDEFQLRKIFTRKITSKLVDFVPVVKLLGDSVTVATLDIYKIISKRFSQNQDPFFFQLFNIHDISQVFEGVLRSSKANQDSKLSFLRLWFHECLRVFTDRFIDEQDQRDCKQILDEQLLKHFDISDTSLMQSRQYGLTSTTEESMPIFGNFLMKNQQYGEIRDISSLHETIKCKLREVLHQKNPIVLLNTAVEQVARIARVLSQENGHLIILGDDTQGRETLTKVAGALYNYKVYGLECSVKKNWLVEFTPLASITKQIYRSCAMDNNGCCLMLKDEQITESVLEMVYLMVSSVEIPNLFSRKEILEMRKGIKDTDADGTHRNDIMGWFRKRVGKNLHVVLCIKPTNQNLLRLISEKYSGLLRCMTVNTFAIWTPASYSQVGHELLPASQGHKDYNSFFNLLHTITVEESNTNLITPIFYLDFLETYKVFRAQAKEEYEKQMKLYKMAIQEVQNVRGRIGTLKEQAVASERKAEVCRQDCNGKLAAIQRQQSDASLQSKLVASMNLRVNAEVEEYEGLAAKLKEDWSGALEAFEKETECLQDLMEEDLTHIRSYYSPPPLVSRVLDAVMILLDRDESWPEAKIQLAHPDFIKTIQSYDKSRVTQEKIHSLKKFVQNKEFTPEDVAKYSNGARIMCAWVHALDKYAKCYLTEICPQREQLEGSEQSIIDNKHGLMLASDKLQLLTENLAEIQTIYEVKQQLRQSLEEDAKQAADVLERATSVINLLDQESSSKSHVQEWKRKLVQLEKRMDNLEGDAILTSAYQVYAGPFCSEVRNKMKNRWAQAIEAHLGIQIDYKTWSFQDNFSFDEVLTTKEKIEGIHGEYSRPDNTKSQKYDWFVDNIILVKKSARPVLCIDPQSSYTKDKVNCIHLKTTEGLHNVINYYIKNQGPIQDVLYVTTTTSLDEIDKLVTSKCSVINFTLDRDSLEEHFINVIAEIINCEDESRRKTLIQSVIAEKTRIADIEIQVPKFVITCGGSTILNNGEFPDTLTALETQLTESFSKLAAFEEQILQIEQKRGPYFFTAKLLARLFECIQEMSRVFATCAVSLELYTSIMIKMLSGQMKSLQSDGENDESSCALRKEEIEKLIDFIDEQVTEYLFKFVCTSMPRSHRYIFGLIFSTKTLLYQTHKPEEKHILETELKFLWKVLSATTEAITPLEEEICYSDCESSAWIKPVQQNYLKQLSKLKSFENLSESVFKSRVWEDWIKSSISIELPNPWNEPFSPIQKMIVFAIFRPDFIPVGIVSLAQQVLGESYADAIECSRLVDVKEITENNILHEYQTCKTIRNTSSYIFFTNDAITSAISDPLTSVVFLANSFKPPHKLFSLSISKLNVTLAKTLIKESAEKGYWVYLSNVDLAPNLLYEVEKVLMGPTHQNFKLWIQSTVAFSTCMPESCVQNAVKIFLELPQTKVLRRIRLENKMSGALENSEDLQNPREFQKLMKELCSLHCELQSLKDVSSESDQYFPLILDIDFEIAAAVLKTFLIKYQAETSTDEEEGNTPVFPLWALKYMVGLQYKNHFGFQDLGIVEKCLSELFSSNRRNSSSILRSNDELTSLEQDDNCEDVEQHNLELTQVIFTEKTLKIFLETVSK